MKKVFFIRHAKSSWADLHMRDIDRPLNARGNRDAPLMASFLKKSLEKSGNSQSSGSMGIISSPSKRTRETFDYFKTELQVPKENVIIDNSLYHASESTIVDSLYQLPDTWNVALLFTHNPGISYLATMIEQEHQVNVPTCGILETIIDCETWSNVDLAHAKLLNFYFPKMSLL